MSIDIHHHMLPPHLVAVRPCPPTRPCTQSCGWVSIPPCTWPLCEKPVSTPPNPGLPPLETPVKSGSPNALRSTWLVGTNTSPSPLGPYRCSTNSGLFPTPSGQSGPAKAGGSAASFGAK